MQTIAVIGGGFSGTMAAVNLARLSDKPLRVVLINDKHPLGRGVAFGTKRIEHLLNVAARNMSAVPDQPEHFLDWLRTRVDYADLPAPQLRETFVPRAVYGDYLRALLLNYMRPIDEHHPAAIEVVEDEAVDIVTDQDDARSARNVRVVGHVDQQAE
ncbi:MAG: FAD/NAD(P)-binding protein, partial [Planctomycetaceae bacterium]